jgi:hypothetical protein
MFVNNMGKKGLFLIMLLCLFLTSVNAQDTFARDQDIDFKYYCFDCVPATTCNVTVLYPNYSLMVDNVPLASQGSYHNYTISSSLNNVNGKHTVFGACDNSGTMVEIDQDFYVTESGYTLTTGQALLYIAWIMFVSVLFYVLLMSVFVSPKQPQGEFSINWYKQYRIGAVAMSYVLLLFLFGGLRSIFASYLYFDNASQVFYTAYIILLSGVIPLLVLTAIISLVNLLSDRKLYQRINRGFEW